jgi:hypothetical protein
MPDFFREKDLTPSRSRKEIPFRRVSAFGDFLAPAEPRMAGLPQATG